MALTSAVRIANMALAHIGAKNSIESLSESSSEANQCNLWYDDCRKEVLEAYNWTFARKRGNLALDSDTPPVQWMFNYQIPADCIKPRLIWNPLGTRVGKAVPFEVETNSIGVPVILTDMEDAILVYTWDQQNPLIFSRFFVRVLSHCLASKIAWVLTGKQAVQTREENAYANHLRLASTFDAVGEQEDAPQEADWINARNGGAQFRGRFGFNDGNDF